MSRQAPEAPKKRRPMSSPKKPSPKKEARQEESGCRPYKVVDYSDVVAENERIHSFLRMNDFLNSLPSDEVGSMGKVFNNPIQFSGGASAKAFRIIVDPSLGIGSKVMVDDERARREIAYYRMFTDNLLRRNGCPNFPLVSRCERCDVCSITQTRRVGDDYVTVKKPIERNCFTLFSELADGDLESVIRGLSSEEVLGMIFQVWMACASLERKGLVHNDLHFGNILYHSEEPERKNKGKWLWYRDGSDEIYVKHTGRLWVLWDFGMMVENGERESRDGEPFIVHNTFKNDIKLTFFPLLKKRFRQGSGSDVSVVKYSHPFIEVFDDLLDENESIIDVLKLLAYNDYYTDDTGNTRMMMITNKRTDDMDIINSRPYIV